MYDAGRPTEVAINDEGMISRYYGLRTGTFAWALGRATSAFDRDHMGVEATALGAVRIEHLSPILLRVVNRSNA